MDPSRQFAISVARRLQEAGFQALFAGGCVRDQLLGKIPKDYDVATSATPDTIRDLFGNRRTIAVGASFGVITVLAPKGVENVEVATFRSDGTYSDGRHPDSVVFSTPEEDAQRRDFTINGLFLEPIHNRIIDYVGGQADLRAGIIRAIGDADARIHEDKLRMLRGVRFAATMSFALAAGTREAIKRNAGQIDVVSAERIGNELTRMLLSPQRATAAVMLDENDLMKQPALLPESATLLADLRRRQGILRQLENLQDPELPEVLVVLLGGVDDGAVYDAVGERLRLPRAVRDDAAWIARHAATLTRAADLPWSQVQPLLIQRPIHGALRYLRGLESLESGSTASTFIQSRLRLPREELDPAPLVDGRSLQQIGIAPGPGLGKMIHLVRQKQLDGEITHTEEALTLVRQLQLKVAETEDRDG